jgi:hypothetical protein
LSIIRAHFPPAFSARNPRGSAGEKRQEYVGHRESGWQKIARALFLSWVREKSESGGGGDFSHGRPGRGPLGAAINRPHLLFGQIIMCNSILAHSWWSGGPFNLNKYFSLSLPLLLLLRACLLSETKDAAAVLSG